ncbi:hypothetical protein [Acidicapsa ligni]|uniref:hypothetical protein n=1 Tax=Acidicapsa ligni TaxID=542300 RepID=UPI0021E04153|nr:hypothetical protein [Acidicapsa ligni]
MHLTIPEILWALVLAGHLMLLIILMGRDRIRSFPWFTAAIAVSTTRLLADHLLHGKITTLAFYWQSYSSMAVDAIIGVLVLVELTRRVFSSGKAGLLLKPKGWLGWTLITFVISIAAVWAWGPWPSWKALNADPQQLPLLLVVLTALKGQLFLALLTVQVAILMRLFGPRFGFGWKSHAQQIALGLSTNALGLLVVQGITDTIKRNVHLTTREQYEHVVRLVTNIDNAHFALWFIVLLWLIVWMWRDEPGPSSTAMTPIPVEELPGEPLIPLTLEGTEPGIAT